MKGVASMTGFASAEGVLPDGRGFSVTIKGVNHRHLDLQMRLPVGMDALEADLRKAIRARIRRGHVEVTLALEKAAAGAALELDEALLEAYVSVYWRAAEKFGIMQEPDLPGLLRMPGVLSAGTAADDVEEVAGPVLAGLEDVLRRFEGARAQEGEVLAAELRAAMARLARLAQEARTLRESVAGAEFARLKMRLHELLQGSPVSEERLLTEAALLAGRGDVEEELVRLRTHIERFGALLDAGGEVGRPLDFLLQELHREANTMLAKTGGSAGAAGLRLTEIGLEMKMELERVREQVQNLE